MGNDILLLNGFLAGGVYQIVQTLIEEADVLEAYAPLATLQSILAIDPSSSELVGVIDSFGKALEGGRLADAAVLKNLAAKMLLAQTKRFSPTPAPSFFPQTRSTYAYVSGVLSSSSGRIGLSLRPEGTSNTKTQPPSEPLSERAQEYLDRYPKLKEVLEGAGWMAHEIAAFINTLLQNDLFFYSHARDEFAHSIDPLFECLKALGWNARQTYRFCMTILEYLHSAGAFEGSTLLDNLAKHLPLLQKTLWDAEKQCRFACRLVERHSAFKENFEDAIPSWAALSAPDILLSEEDRFEFMIDLIGQRVPFIFVYIPRAIEALRKTPWSWKERFEFLKHLTKAARYDVNIAHNMLQVIIPVLEGAGFGYAQQRELLGIVAGHEGIYTDRYTFLREVVEVLLARPWDMESRYRFLSLFFTPTPYKEDTTMHESFLRIDKLILTQALDGLEKTELTLEEQAQLLRRLTYNSAFKKSASELWVIVQGLRLVVNSFEEIVGLLKVAKDYTFLIAVVRAFCQAGFTFEQQKTILVLFGRDKEEELSYSWVPSALPVLAERHWSTQRQFEFLEYFGKGGGTLRWAALNSPHLGAALEAVEKRFSGKGVIFLEELSKHLGQAEWVDKAYAHLEPALAGMERTGWTLNQQLDLVSRVASRDKKEIAKNLEALGILARELTNPVVIEKPRGLFGKVITRVSPRKKKEEKKEEEKAEDLKYAFLARLSHTLIPASDILESFQRMGEVGITIRQRYDILHRFLGFYRQNDFERLCHLIRAMSLAGWDGNQQVQFLEGLILNFVSKGVLLSHVIEFLLEDFASRNLILRAVQNDPFARKFIDPLFSPFFNTMQAKGWSLEEQLDMVYTGTIIGADHESSVKFVLAVDTLEKFGWSRREGKHFFTRIIKSIQSQQLTQFCDSVQLIFPELARAYPLQQDQEKFLISIVDTFPESFHLVLNFLAQDFEPRLALHQQLVETFGAVVVNQYDFIGALVEIMRTAGLDWKTLGTKLVATIHSAGKEFPAALRILCHFSKGLSDHRAIVVFDKMAKILNRLTDYNRDRVFQVLSRFTSILSENILDHIDLWVAIFERWPRLGFQVLDGLSEAVKTGWISPNIATEKEGILRFVEKTNGFLPEIYGLYKKSGEEILEKIQAYAGRMLGEGISVKKAMAIAKGHEHEGGLSFLLAVIHLVSPTSGASFIRKEEELGLLQTILQQGDRRKAIPQALRGRVKTFEMGQGVWQLRREETFDPDGKIKSLVERLRTHEGEKKTNDEDFAQALTEFLKSKRGPEDLEKARQVLYAYAATFDLLQEKIDRIKHWDYSALLLLEHLLQDKDNLAQLVFKAMKNVPKEALVSRGKRKSMGEDPSRLVQELKRVWAAAQVPREKRLSALARILGVYDEKEVEEKILSRDDVPEDLKDALRSIRKESVAAISKEEVAKELLREPLALVQREKRKFWYVGKDGMTVGLRPVKGPLFGLYGLSSGVCTASDMSLWNNKNFWLLAITDEDAKQVGGYIHVVETKIEGRKYLTLPGVNPSAEFLGTVDAERLFNGMMEKIVEMAIAAGYAGVYIPTTLNILSNRNDIHTAVQKKNYPTKTIPPVQWNRIPEPYPFNQVFVVWEG